MDNLNDLSPGRDFLHECQRISSYNQPGKAQPPTTSQKYTTTHNKSKKHNHPQPVKISATTRNQPKIKLQQPAKKKHNHPQQAKKKYNHPQPAMKVITG